MTLADRFSTVIAKILTLSEDSDSLRFEEDDEGLFRGISIIYHILFRFNLNMITLT